MRWLPARALLLRVPDVPGLPRRGVQPVLNDLNALIKRPLDKTLAQYGLLPVDFEFMLKEQGWACGCCGKTPASGRLFVDHEHVRGWKRMPPEERRKYVRGLACYTCNRFVLNHRINIKLLAGAIAYLTQYEQRRSLQQRLTEAKSREVQ
jgi:hypothetical protein